MDKHLSYSCIQTNLRAWILAFLVCLMSMLFIFEYKQESQQLFRNLELEKRQTENGKTGRRCFINQPGKHYENNINGIKNFKPLSEIQVHKTKVIHVLTNVILNA